MAEGREVERTIGKTDARAEREDVGEGSPDCSSRSRPRYEAFEGSEGCPPPRSGGGAGRGRARRQPCRTPSAPASPSSHASSKEGVFRSTQSLPHPPLNFPSLDPPSEFFFFFFCWGFSYLRDLGVCNADRWKLERSRSRNVCREGKERSASGASTTATTRPRSGRR